jgi:hypothetical protein
MPNALLHVAWEPCLLTPRHDGPLESYAKRKMGMVPPGLPYDFLNRIHDPCHPVPQHGGDSGQEDSQH